MLWHIFLFIFFVEKQPYIVSLLQMRVVMLVASNIARFKGSKERIFPYFCLTKK